MPTRILDSAGNMTNDPNDTLLGVAQPWGTPIPGGGGTDFNMGDSSGGGGGAIPVGGSSGPSTTLGVPTGSLVLGGADILAKALASAFAPTPYQTRKSYAGTSADPVQYMTDLKGKLDDLFQSATAHLQQPIRSQVDFGQAQPQPLGTFAQPQRMPYGATAGTAQGVPGGTIAATDSSAQAKAAATLLGHALGGG